MKRHVYKKYSSEYLGDYTFQIDEEGNPYWVYTTLKTLTTSGCKVPYGCITVDAVTGVMTKYNNLEDIPTWVDLVYSGEMIEELYNRYGRYINGFINFSKKGVTATTDDYGYLMVDDDIYIYTGVTSAGRDESNIGFILANSRTGECIYYPVAGAEEYSAMSAAEGLVQNFGYVASFPSLVLVDEEPTYVLVLKDANGLVKKYAMVNYKNYTIAVAEDTLEACERAYRKALVTKNPEVIEDSSSTKTENVVVDSINFIVVDGITVCYIKGNNKVFRVSFAEELILINTGDTVNVTYVASDDSILQAVTVE
ncbi:MAG: hypothetical protein IKL08_01625 [Clostridia bacterium]|nr:hypothetical protein [Clostridia bacterium]